MSLFGNRLATASAPQIAAPPKSGLTDVVPANLPGVRRGMFGRAGQWVRSRDWERIAAALRDDPSILANLDQGRRQDQTLAQQVLEATQQREAAEAQNEHLRGFIEQAYPDDAEGQQLAWLSPSTAIQERIRDRRGPTVRDLTPEEARARGLRPGTVAQIGDDGGLHVVQAPREQSASASQSMGAQTIDFLAQQYITTGNLPSGISRSPGMASRVYGRAAELASEMGLSAQATAIRGAAFRANQTAFAQLRRQRTAVESFERTARANLELAAQLSERVGGRDGAPVVNRWLLAGRRQIAGDPDVAAFHTALTSALNEYAKVLSGATGAAGITEGAREEAESLLSTANTPQQVRAIMETMRQEMHNRIESFERQEADLRASMGGAEVIEDTHDATAVARGQADAIAAATRGPQTPAPAAAQTQRRRYDSRTGRIQ